MKKMITRAGAGFGVAVAALAVGLAGCASHNQGNPDAAPSAGKMQSAGASMQKEGVMSQADYVRIEGLEYQVARTRTISDADLDWTLTHISAQNNAIARARFFNTLSNINPMTAAQKAKILPAITPYLSSTDRLDQAGAQRVQKKMQAA